MNGKRVADAFVSVRDQSFQRGDGIFEACRIVGTRVRALNKHLDRLERSAAALDLPIPSRSTLEGWLLDGAQQGEGYLRLFCTRGAQGVPPSTIVLWQPLPVPRVRSLCPMVAPWHPAGFSDDWATVKWLAYGNNVHSSRLAKRAGYDDALLLARGWGADDNADDLDRVVLDGPNFALAWLAHDDSLCVPDWRRLGMLESVTSSLLVDVATPPCTRVREGVFRLRDLVTDAREVFVVSTTNDIAPVSRVGSYDVPVVDPHPDSLRPALLASLKSRW